MSAKMRAFGGESDEGWTFEVWLHHGHPTGEIRVSRQGQLKFTELMGIPEIAIFAAKRDDLIAAYVDDLIRRYQPQ